MLAASRSDGGKGSDPKFLTDQESPEPLNPAPPVPTESRRLALETAAAFENEGFRIRDSEWQNSLSKGQSAFLQICLFSGNQYWFVAASPTNAVKIRMVVYDPSGKPLKSDSWQDGGAHPGSRAALGFAPTISGMYFVAVEFLDIPGGSPNDVCFVYAYK